MAMTSIDDWVSVSQFVGRYNWLLDSGNAEEWASLWTEDGAFGGVLPKPVVGRAALVRLAEAVFRDNDQGMMRHLFGNLVCVPSTEGESALVAKFYNHVSVWGRQARPFAMSLNHMVLIRNGGEWLIRRNDVRILPPGDAPDYLRA